MGKGGVMYIDEFMAAAERTKRLGLDCPDIGVSNGRFLSEEKMNKFPFALRDAVGEIGIEEVVAQCLSIHHKLLGPVSTILGAPTYYTIGYVETSEGTLFEQDETSLKAILDSRLSSFELNIHAWLTLPSMEVLDFSLPTSIAVIKTMNKGIGGLIASKADELKHGMKYHPLLVGDDFLRKTGALIEC
jgi:hypothetical protein